jgi:SAM-dependent methyltransferase
VIEQQLNKTQAEAKDLYSKALTCADVKSNDQALDLLFKSIELDPEHAPSFALMGKIFSEEKNTMQAIEAYARAIQIDSFETAYKQSFINLVSPMEMQQENLPLKNMILECMQDDAVDFSSMGRLWMSILKHDSNFKKNFKKPDRDALLDTFFVNGLQKTVVFDAGFEKFLTDLRRMLLDETDPAYKPLIDALAVYCRMTEYIFHVSDEEKRKIKPDNKLYFETEKPPVENVVAITPISAGASTAVQEQYEEFPYPKWTHINPFVASLDTESFLHEGGNILNAGCGTGKEAIELAAAFPKANVLAVDLSRASLSYGIRKAREHGIKNVEFRQADILELGVLDRKFDFIASSGVLHHMDNPSKGLSVLAGLLKEGGIMRIALYSALARKKLNEAIKIIREKEYRNDADGIRQFRFDAPKILKADTYKNICSFRDYYYMSECRDLLFHVQEHQMSISEIKDMLDSFNLEFIKFYVAPSVAKRYVKKFPDDPQGRNLKNWNKFETLEPDTFKEMYKFWCKKA